LKVICWKIWKCRIFAGDVCYKLHDNWQGLWHWVSPIICRRLEKYLKPLRVSRLPFASELSLKENVVFEATEKKKVWHTLISFMENKFHQYFIILLHQILQKSNFFYCHFSASQIFLYFTTILSKFVLFLKSKGI